MISSSSEFRASAPFLDPDAQLQSARREPTLVGLAASVLRHRILILRLSLIFGLVGGVSALVSKRTYTSDFSFAPQEASAKSGLSAIASDFGVTLGGSPTQSPDFYVQLVQTREILGRLIDQPLTYQTGRATVTIALLDSLAPGKKPVAERRLKAIAKLREFVTARADLKTSVVSVSATAGNPDLAWALSKRMLEEINRFNSETRHSRATLQRQFVEEQVAKTKAQLQAAEERETSFTMRNRVYQGAPDLQLQKNRLDREIGLLDPQYATMWNTFMRARMDEIENAPLITVVENPDLPTRPDARGTITKTIVAATLGMMIAFFIVFLRESFGKTTTLRDEEVREFQALRAATFDDLRNPGRTVGQLIRVRRNRAVAS